MSNSPNPSLVVRPRTARQMLGGCGNERLYNLLNRGELQSFRDGRARLIIVDSIHRYIARHLAEAGGTPAATPARAPPRRDRPAKSTAGKGVAP
jgi:hypothetical protein